MPDVAFDDSNTLDYIHCYCKQEQGYWIIHCDTEKCPFGKGLAIMPESQRLLVPRNGI